MTDAVSYLMSSLKKDRERSAAFRAVGQMVLVLKDRMDLAPVIQTVKINLPRQDIGPRYPTVPTFLLLKFLLAFSLSHFLIKSLFLSFFLSPVLHISLLTSSVPIQSFWPECPGSRASSIPLHQHAGQGSRLQH